MKLSLLAKFNLILILLLGLGSAAGLYLSWRFLKADAHDQVIQQARLMMASAGATRAYTSQQVNPLLISHQLHARKFLAQTVPAFAATESFNYVRKDYPMYTYKEATLNPTNLRDRAVEWEADIVNGFRNFPDRKEIVGERNTPEGMSLFLAKPLKALPACLECHSTPDKAPAAMIKNYGSANGFGWKAGETIGAQIVSVPEAVPLEKAADGFRTIATWFGVLAVVTIVLLNIALRTLVIRPVARLSTMADEISQGNMNLPELPVQGHDEISDLARSFNRMYLSLVKAMKLLGSE